jgi:hypothetical protein
LMFICCSRLLSLPFSANHIPRTHITSSAPQEQMTHWSVAHVNASWNMSKRAWVHQFAWLNTPVTRCDCFGTHRIWKAIYSRLYQLINQNTVI